MSRYCAPDWSLRRVIGPGTEIVSLTEAKAQCRVDISADDTYIGNLIVTARERIEAKTGKCAYVQTWNQFFSRFPLGDDYLEIWKGPLLSVVSLQYTDKDAAVTVMVAGTDYIVDTAHDPGRIYTPTNVSWPTAELYPGMPVRAQFTAGYDSSPSSIPYRLKQAVLLYVAHMYQNREPVLAESGASAVTLPLMIDDLISDFCYDDF